MIRDGLNVRKQLAEFQIVRVFARRGKNGDL
jgi:hypothetical protein